MRKWIVTFFGSGLIPFAPGTMGSIAASLLLIAIHQLFPDLKFIHWQIILIGVMLLAGYLTIQNGLWIVTYFKRKDPGPVVLDEVAGIALTNFLLPMYTDHRQLWVIGIALVAFRIFDITKLPPVKKLEQLPLGYGILFDDLAAAVYANLLCQLVIRFALPI